MLNLRDSTALAQLEHHQIEQQQQQRRRRRHSYIAHARSSSSTSSSAPSRWSRSSTMPDRCAQLQYMDLHRALEHVDRTRVTTATAKDAQLVVPRQRERSVAATKTITTSNSVSSHCSSSTSTSVQTGMETNRMMGRYFAGSPARQDRDLYQQQHHQRIRSTRHTMSSSDNCVSIARDSRDDTDDLLAALQMQQQRASYFVATDAHESLAAGATSFDHRSAVHDNNGDDDDDCDDTHSGYLVDSPEIAAFLGMTTVAAPLPTAAAPAYTTTAPPPFLRAASFSSQQQYKQRGIPVPCSPPVPIPRKQLRRRRNTVTGSLLSPYTTGAASEHTYSRTQSEARLWDDDWHFKLSLEARESFESSKAPRASGSGGRALPAPRRRAQSCTSSLCTGASTTTAAGASVWKAQSTSSMTSTADTVRDDDSPGSDCCCDDDDGDDDEAHHVFDMDDL